MALATGPLRDYPQDQDEKGEVRREQQHGLCREHPRQPRTGLLRSDFSYPAVFRFCSVASEGISQINLH